MKLVTITAMLLLLPVFLDAQETPNAAIRIMTPDGGIRILPSQAIPLRPVTITRGTAKQLLESERIVPDANAIALLYSVNPTISHLDTLSAGSTILIPDLSRIGQFHAGDQVQFIFEPELRALAQAEISRSVALSARTPRSGSLATYSQQVRAASRGLSRLNLEASPITTEALTELRASAAVVSSVAATVAAGQTPSPSELSELSEVADQVEALQEATASGGAVKVWVTVTPIRESDNGPASGVQLYYATLGDHDSDGCKGVRTPPCRWAFQRNYAPHKAQLNSNGQYAVWAERAHRIVSCDLVINPKLGENDEFSLGIPRDERCSK